jgi:hypothetical protein
LRQRDEMNQKREAQFEAQKQAVNKQYVDLQAKLNANDKHISSTKRNTIENLGYTRDKLIGQLGNLQPNKEKGLALYAKIVEPFDRKVDEARKKTGTDSQEYQIAIREQESAFVHFGEEFEKTLFDPNRKKTQEEQLLVDQIQKIDAEIRAVREGTHPAIAPLQETSRKLLEECEKASLISRDIKYQIAKLKSQKIIADRPALLLLPEGYKLTSAGLQITPEQHRSFILQNPLAQAALDVSDVDSRGAFMEAFGKTIYPVQTAKGARYAIALPTKSGFSLTNEEAGDEATATFINSLIGSTPDVKNPLLQTAMLFLDTVLNESIEKCQAMLNGLIDQALFRLVAHRFITSPEIASTLGHLKGKDFLQKAEIILEEWTKKYKSEHGGAEPSIPLKIDRLRLEWTERLKAYYSIDEVKKRVNAMKDLSENQKKDLIAHEIASGTKVNGASIGKEVNKASHAIHDQVRPISNILAMVEDFRESLLYTLLAGVKEFTGMTSTSHFHKPFTRIFLGGVVGAVNQVAKNMFQAAYGEGELKPFAMVKQAVSTVNVALTAMRKEFEGQK